MNRLLFLGSMFVVLWGCAEKKDQNNEDVESTEKEMVELEAEKNKDVKFPVYDFAAFEPLLNKDDGKTYVVNFWATWCQPCIEEMPHFEKVNLERSDNNVEVILVNLDMPNMWKTRLEPFVEKKKIKSRVVILDDHKQNDWIPKVSQDWGGGIPATLIYNKDKRAFYERGFTYEELNEELNKFIN